MEKVKDWFYKFFQVVKVHLLKALHFYTEWCKAKGLKLVANKNWAYNEFLDLKANTEF